MGCPATNDTPSGKSSSAQASTGAMSGAVEVTTHPCGRLSAIASSISRKREIGSVRMTSAAFLHAFAAQTLGALDRAQLLRAASLSAVAVHADQAQRLLRLAQRQSQRRAECVQSDDGDLCHKCLSDVKRQIVNWRAVHWSLAMV